MENWSWIEVLWTLVAVIGAYFSANNIKDGIKDLNALDKLEKPNSFEEKILKITAWGNTRRDVLRELIQLMFIGLGLWAGTLPQPPNPSLLGYVFQGILITASLFLTVSALGDHYDRIKIHKLGESITLRDNGL
jgi:hypothetical protein